MKKHMEKSFIIALIILLVVFAFSFLPKKISPNFQLILYGCLSFYFLVNFILTRYFPSLFIAIIAAGYIIKRFLKERN
jgi:hypothetical protein